MSVAGIFLPRDNLDEIEMQVSGPFLSRYMLQICGETINSVIDHLDRFLLDDVYILKLSLVCLVPFLLEEAIEQ